MRTKHLIFIALMTFSVVFVNAQEEKKETKSTFKLDAEFRNRIEMSPSIGGRNVLVSEGTDMSVTIWQRSRLTASYKSDKLESKFSVQDVRPFVQNASSWPSDNGTSFSVSEAWAKYYFINNDSRKLGIKLGRQVLNNSDGRLLWKRNWNHYGAAHDAITLECDNIDFDAKWQLGFSANSADFPGTATLASKKYRNLGFFMFSKNFGEVFTLNITDLFETYENGFSSAIYGRNTVGLNPVVNFGGLTFNGSFYYQHGTPAIFNTEDQYAAMMFSGNLSYKLGILKATAGYDYYSGEAYDDDQTDNKNKVFNTYMHGGHLFFGNTDFHLKLYGKNRGLTNINFKLSADISEKTSLYGAFHNISFAKTNFIFGFEENVEFKSVGNNIDLVWKQILGKNMNVQVGYSLMLPSEDFVNYTIGNNSDAKMHNWAWVMFTFKPNFLKVDM